jgi:hypothetical protein
VHKHLFQIIIRMSVKEIFTFSDGRQWMLLTGARSAKDRSLPCWWDRAWIRVHSVIQNEKAALPRDMAPPLLPKKPRREG